MGRGKRGRRVAIQGRGKGQVDMTAFNQLTAGMPEDQRSMIMQHAMQAAANPNALKIAQKVGKGKKGRKMRKGKKMTADQAMMIKDELMGNPGIANSFGLSNLPTPPSGGLPIGFPSIPPEVRAAFEGNSESLSGRGNGVNGSTGGRTCDQCKQSGDCLHDGETDSFLCSATCQQIMRSKQGIRDGEHRCHNPSCLEEGINVCGSCKRSFYCTSQCQKAHWKSHKKLCRMVKKAMKEKEAAMAAQAEENEKIKLQKQEKKRQEENLFGNNNVDTNGVGNEEDDTLTSLLAVDDDEEEGEEGEGEEGWLQPPTAQQKVLLTAVEEAAAAGDLNLTKMGGEDDEEEVDMDALVASINDES